MKNIFHGHYKPSDEEFKKMWNESIFACDANILLNMYRYSKGTRTELMKLLVSIKDKIWIPNQAAEEYFRNRLSVSGGLAGEYDKVDKTISELYSNLCNKKRHPFINDDLLNEFDAVIIKIRSEFESSKLELNNRIQNDEILESITDLFSGKVGIRLTKEKLEQIYKEGKDRYEADIPPGFKDGKKDNSGNLYRKFGDLVIWNELIEKAKTDQKSLIFITDDKKEDWWNEYNGKTIGPLPALIHEFKERSGLDFYMYTADRFMQASKDYTQEQIDDTAITEIREIRIEDEIIKQYLEHIDVDTVRHNFQIISEDELTKYLNEYIQLRCDDSNGFIGLKHFVTTYLAEKGYEINHSYALVNKLCEKGVIEIYEKIIGDYYVKAIRMK